MRLKRLARLGTAANTPQPQQQEEPQAESSTPPPAHPPASASSRLLANLPPASSSTSPSETPKPTAPSPKPPAKPFLAQPKPNPSPSTLSLKRPSNASTSRPEPVGPRVVSTKPLQPLIKADYKTWETVKIGQVFAVTLSRSKAQDSDWSICWLKDLEEELKEENYPQPLATTPDLIDRLLIARLSLDPAVMAKSDDSDKLTILAGLPQSETVFEYLAGCWKRIYIANKDAQKYSFTEEEKGQWKQVMEKIKALVVSYCGMTLEDPTMFPQPEGKPTGPAEFLPLLLSIHQPIAGDHLTSAPTPPPTVSGPLQPADLLPFLQDLAAGFTPDTLSDVISPTLSLFFQQWFSISPTPDILGSEWRRYLGAMNALVQVKAVAGLLPSLPIWVAPNVVAPKLEWQSLLGPLTRLSVFPREFTSIFNVYNSIVRASPEARESILDFFALTLRLNSRRAGMRVDPRLVSTDGYMTNLQVVLLKLFEPVMDARFSKIDKVDAAYFKFSKRIDISEETKVRATKEEADGYFGEAMEVDAKPNFISDLFFLLNAFLHLGLVKTISTRGRAEKNLSEIEKELKRTEASRGDWEGNPALTAQGEAAIKKLKGDLAVLHASIHAYDTQLLDNNLIRPTVSFLGFLMTWLVRLVDPDHAFPAKPVSLPLPKEAPMAFRMLPEYLFENVADYFEFLARYEPEALDDVDKDIFITFSIVFLTPDYVNNPFMKAKLVTILSYGLYPAGYWRQGPLFDRLSVLGVSTEHLMPTLIRFYIDVEATGGHTQFWDKFNYRRDMGHIFKALWGNPLHREAFINDDFDQFIRFVNMLMNDTTFHLDESLTGLTKIGTIEAQRANTAAWAAMDQAERQDLEGELNQAEGSVPWHTQMGLDNVKLIKDFTATTMEPFVAAEIVDRLAASLDENLMTLVGPKMTDLKVTNPDKYKFKPKDLLAAIAQIYLNLASAPEFIRAVANDGRAYSKKLFEKFARTLKNRAIMTEIEVAEVVSFTQKVEDMKATIDMEDEREIPDEFLDPLLSTLMKDPVILPVSRISIDRGTIRTVLLSKEADPFNNVPLKFEECLPDIELKARIDAWVAEGSTKQADSVMDVDQL
ncbi:ubiquitin-conjugation factor E4 B [Cryptococcus wingfieldii CBS 7118]|uniref:RING-type E3 ubiquitin transferase n=1 Tax=Cryptococcus wingfieldii CBS 7118 TaxID=1295528 RepID=A0A1E3K2M0_9TREE|nr:ubiquitin-conjugation factor E4 B [Cryptococcus wingfieldii CBS 7118]ODO06452.1 ubiquitin-conjugation factor E4 B [Cryptococcus wingfieldii CBS 7118]